MFEIHGDAAADVGLDLPQAPPGLPGMAHQHARLEHGVQILGFILFSQGLPRMSCAKPDIPGLLGSRICHDLISPLGAISNGIELLAMTGESQLPEWQLISESIQNANARIRFFRIAFGTSPSGQKMAASEIRSILEDLGQAGRLDIRWLPDADIPRDQVKQAFLALQCLETAMPWGGVIDVTQQNGGWTLTGQAERMRMEPGHWDTLCGKADCADVTAAHVQFALLAEALRPEGRTPEVELEESRIRLGF